MPVVNTIRHPRKRPRVDSLCWRTFGWLLKMEAALAVNRRARELYGLGVVQRGNIPPDRTAIFVARAQKLIKLTPALRRID